MALEAKQALNTRICWKTISFELTFTLTAIFKITPLLKPKTYGNNIFFLIDLSLKL